MCLMFLEKINFLVMAFLPGLLYLQPSADYVPPLLCQVTSLSLQKLSQFISHFTFTSPLLCQLTIVLCMQKLSQFTSHVTFILHHTSDKKPVSRDTVNYFAFSVQIQPLFHFHFPDKTINHNAPHRAQIAQIIFFFHFYFTFLGNHLNHNASQ